MTIVRTGLLGVRGGQEGVHDSGHMVGPLQMRGVVGVADLDETGIGTYSTDHPLAKGRELGIACPGHHQNLSLIHI